MKTVFNLAVIGTNFIAPKFIDAAERSAYFRLHSILSRKIQTGVNFRENNQYGNDVLVFNHLEEMLDDDRVDAVYIASPNAIHFEQASACIKTFKPVFVEKPISSNATELAALIA